MVDVPPTARPRRFVLHRTDDVSGKSGTGIVATGVEFPDGPVAYYWRTDPATVQFADRIEDVQAIHGHGDRTTVVWLD